MMFLLTRRQLQPSHLSLCSQRVYMVNKAWCAILSLRVQSGKAQKRRFPCYGRAKSRCSVADIRQWAWTLHGPCLHCVACSHGPTVKDFKLQRTAIWERNAAAASIIFHPVRWVCTVTSKLLTTWCKMRFHVLFCIYRVCDITLQGLALGVTTRPPNELTTLPATADEAQLARTAEGFGEIRRGWAKEFGDAPALSDIYIHLGSTKLQCFASNLQFPLTAGFWGRVYGTSRSFHVTVYPRFSQVLTHGATPGRWILHTSWVSTAPPGMARPWSGTLATGSRRPCGRAGGWRPKIIGKPLRN